MVSSGAGEPWAVRAYLLIRACLRNLWPPKPQGMAQGYPLGGSRRNESFQLCQYAPIPQQGPLRLSSRFASATPAEPHDRRSGVTIGRNYAGMPPILAKYFAFQ